MIPCWILREYVRARKLSHGDALVYGALLYTASGNTFTSDESSTVPVSWSFSDAVAPGRISKLCGLSKRNVNRSLDRLRQLNLIQTIQDPTGQWPFIYVFLDPVKAGDSKLNVTRLHSEDAFYLPLSVIRFPSKALSPGAKIFLGFVRRNERCYKGYMDWGQKRQAKELGISVRQIQKFTAQLKARGLLAITYRCYNYTEDPEERTSIVNSAVTDEVLEVLEEIGTFGTAPVAPGTAPVAFGTPSPVAFGTAASGQEVRTIQTLKTEQIRQSKPKTYQKEDIAPEARRLAPDPAAAPSMPGRKNMKNVKNSERSNPAPPTSATQTDNVASILTGGAIDLRLLKARMALQRGEKKAEEQRQKNLESARKKAVRIAEAEKNPDANPYAPKRSPGGELFELWRREFVDSFPEVAAPKRWSIKDKSLANSVLSRYDHAIVHQAAVYLIRNWALISKRLFGKNAWAVPTLGALSFRLDELIAESAIWMKLGPVVAEYQSYGGPNARRPAEVEQRYVKAMQELSRLGFKL